MTQGQACASCKYQRRKCDSNCILAPHFPPDRKEEFLSVHRLFGVSNIQKMLRNLTPEERSESIKMMVFHAKARKRDPVHGCLGILRALHNQAEMLMKELDMLRNQMYRREQMEQLKQQQQQQQQQRFMQPPSRFYLAPPPMINACEPAPYISYLENDGGFKNFDMDHGYSMHIPPPPPLLLPSPPHFLDFESVKSYKRTVDLQGMQGLFDRKEAHEAPDESSAESSLKEIQGIEQGSDHEANEGSEIFTFTNGIHERRRIA